MYTAEKRILDHVVVLALMICLTAYSPVESDLLVLLRQDIPAGVNKIIPEEDHYPPVLHSPEWEEPIPVPEYVNSAGAEDSAFVTLDGLSLYFTFVPDVRVHLRFFVL